MDVELEKVEPRTRRLEIHLRSPFSHPAFFFALGSLGRRKDCVDGICDDIK